MRLLLFNKRLLFCSFSSKDGYFKLHILSVKRSAFFVFSTNRCRINYIFSLVVGMLLFVLK